MWKIKKEVDDIQLVYEQHYNRLEEQLCDQGLKLEYEEGDSN